MSLFPLSLSLSLSGIPSLSTPATPAATAASCVRKIVLRKAIAHILGASVDFAQSVCVCLTLLLNEREHFFFGIVKMSFLLHFSPGGDRNCNYQSKFACQPTSELLCLTAKLSQPCHHPSSTDTVRGENGCVFHGLMFISITQLRVFLLCCDFDHIFCLIFGMCAKCLESIFLKTNTPRNVLNSHRHLRPKTTQSGSFRDIPHAWFACHFLIWSIFLFSFVHPS